MVYHFSCFTYENVKNIDNVAVVYRPLDNCTVLHCIISYCIESRGIVKKCRYSSCNGFEFIDEQWMKGNAAENKNLKG